MGGAREGQTHLNTALVLSLLHLKPSALARRQKKKNTAVTFDPPQQRLVDVCVFSYLKTLKCSWLRPRRSKSCRQSWRQQLSSWRRSGLTASDVTFSWPGSSSTQPTVLQGSKHLAQWTNRSGAGGGARASRGRGYLPSQTLMAPS